MQNYYPKTTFFTCCLCPNVTPSDIKPNINLEQEKLVCVCVCVYTWKLRIYYVTCSLSIPRWRSQWWRTPLMILASGSQLSQKQRNCQDGNQQSSCAMAFPSWRMISGLGLESPERSKSTFYSNELQGCRRIVCIHFPVYISTRV